MNYNKDISIGKIIQEKFEERKANGEITKKKFAERLACSTQNINAIFKRETIDTDLLRRISIILGFNFFGLYQDESKANDIKIEITIRNGNVTIRKIEQ
ncbi:MAG: hypothetical protein LBO06_02205 [Bacteroidales bacterium]|jgi:hypothetical protein|nr:hypothetical protein [Bacteroidales bacterium]